MSNLTEGAVLRVLTSEGGADRHPVGRALVVGRGENADLRFPNDRGVSPKHARFFTADGVLHVEDLGSVNGVYIRVRDQVRLRNRDRILVGEHIFSFEIIPDLEAVKSNITKVYSDPTTEVIGTNGERARARLVMHLESGHRGKEYFVGDRAILLGRGEGTHNFMSDCMISLKHAVITPQEDGGFDLRDLDSENGTWRQTRGAVVLSVGDQLLIGRQRLEVEPA